MAVVAADAAGCPATAVVQVPVAAVARGTAELAVDTVLTEHNMAVARRMEMAVMVVRMPVVHSLGGSLVVEAAREMVAADLAVARCRATAVVQDIRLLEAAVVRCMEHLVDQAVGRKASRCRLDEVVVGLD